MSLMVPPAFVNGLEPDAPEKKRRTEGDVPSARWIDTGRSGVRLTNDGLDVLRANEASIEAGKKDIADDEQVPAAEDLRQWCPKHWSL